MKKVFLFDFDGVISDSLPVVVDIYNDLFKKYNLDFHFSKKEFTDVFTGNFLKNMEKFIPLDIFDKFMYEKGQIYIQKVNDFKIFPEMLDVLLELKKDSEIIIISGNVTSFIKEFIKNNNLDFIKEIYGGDIEKCKVKKIERIQKRFPDSDFYYIGDTAGDIKEAKRAGIVSVAVTWGFHNEETLKKENPDFLFRKPEDLLDLL